MITKSIAKFDFIFQIQIYQIYQIFRKLIVHSLIGEACFSSSKYYYKTSQLIEHRHELINQTAVDSK